MPKTIQVEIDSAGQVHPIDSTETLPEGRAILSWPADDDNLMSLAERSLSDWLRPEEDEAWAHLQRDK